MRLTSVTALAMLATAAHAAPASAEVGTFTACLRAGAPGLEPWKRCIRGRPDKVTRFNFEIVHDPNQVIPSGNEVLIDTDEFLITAQCDGSPLLVGFFDEDVLISREQREAPADVGEFQTIDIEPASGDEVFLAIGAELLWHEGYYTPAENPTYIVLLRVLARGDLPDVRPDVRCRFSGEVRMIELPELEVVE